jgi:hypothetical protein
VHELVLAHGVRHPVQDGLRAAVDDDLPAAAEPQLGALVVDVLWLGGCVADLGRDRVRRRVGTDLDEQIRGAVEAAQAYPVGTQTDVQRVYKPVRDLAEWPGVESLVSAYSQSSSIRRKVRCMISSDTERPLYEPPALTVLGSLHELTQSGGSWPCLWKKTIGPPDYVNWIPIANCSS